MTATLDGKVVAITGAGQGIGRAYAIAAADEGARVVINDVSVGATELVEMLAARGAEAVAVTTDIGTWEGARSVIAMALERFGRIDGLVNNAAVLHRRDLADLTEADLDAEIAVNLKGTFACTHHASAHWRAEARAGRRPSASVVNTSSDVIFTGSPGGTGYSATKSAVVGLTQSGSIEGAQYGVRHNCVAPSGLTPMAAGSGLLADDAAPFPEEQDPDSPVNPAHNAPIVMWLLSDQSRHVSGQVFRMRHGGVARMRPVGTERWITAAGGARWAPGELDTSINETMFGSRYPLPVREYPDGRTEAFARLDHR